MKGRITMNIIDGKAISKQIKDEVKEKVAALKAQGVTVTLAVVQVGNDPCDLSEEGCGRLPSAECRCALYRTAGLCIVYTSGDHRAAKEIRY